MFRTYSRVDRAKGIGVAVYGVQSLGLAGLSVQELEVKRVQRLGFTVYGFRSLIQNSLNTA